LRLQDSLIVAQKRLAEAGVDNPALDARLLAAHALGLDRTALLTQNERDLSAKEQTAIDALIARRAAREPVGRILGLREFWGLPFGLNEATLEPRPDTETLVEMALALLPSRHCERLLDLGTGTGCLLLSLLHELPAATGLGIDLASRAVAQAQDNAKRLGLDNRARFQTGNWLDGIEETFDLIISNPPYIPASDIETLAPEVKQFDPLAALDGGADGLDPYRHLIPRLPALLNPEGIVLFEVGIGQAMQVAALMREAGFDKVTIKADLGGIDRCVAGILRR